MSRELSWSHGDLNFKTYRGYHGRILCYDFGNASCTHSTKLLLVLILQFDIVISRFHLSALLWKPMHGLKISSANITAWEKKQDITTWVLGGRFMGGWGCKLFESVSDIALSRKKHKLLLNGCQKIMIQHVGKMVTVAWFSMWANHGNSDLVSFGT